ncbi:MAG: hypothetical protein OEW06_18755, partial [Gemmatimonadota bacterium]|nr:hypothetical protein [Gemmatimonadota bacterium]
LLLEADSPAVAAIPAKARGESAGGPAALAWLADMATYWQPSYESARLHDQGGSGARSDWLVGGDAGTPVGSAGEDKPNKGLSESSASIDWTSVGVGRLGVEISPYAPATPAKSTASNLAEFVVKFQNAEAQDTRFDSLGRALFGNKVKR